MLVLIIQKKSNPTFSPRPHLPGTLPNSTSIKIFRSLLLTLLKICCFFMLLAISVGSFPPLVSLTVSPSTQNTPFSNDSLGPETFPVSFESSRRLALRGQLGSKNSLPSASNCTSSGSMWNKSGSFGRFADPQFLRWIVLARWTSCLWFPCPVRLAAPLCSLGLLWLLLAGLGSCSWFRWLFDWLWWVGLLHSLLLHDIFL